MLPLLPALACLLLVALPARGGEGRRVALLRGLLVFGALAVAGAELLALLGLVTRAAVATWWALVVVATGAALVRARCGGIGAPGGAPDGARLERPERLQLLGLGLLLALLLAVVLSTVPNAPDVMTYHLPRVVHWTQDGDLGPFPTQDTRQVYHPPFAELVDLSFFVLAGAEGAVGPVRLASLVGLLVAVSVVARELGAGPRGQVAAAFLAATMPSAVALVPSGKNGPVLAFLLAALVAYLLILSQELRWRHAVAAGLALGLALLTKLTAYAYAAPFLLAFGIAAGVRHGRRVLGPLGLAALLPLALNLGHWSRNVEAYGFPLFDPARGDALGVQERSLGRTASNLLRHASSHLATSSPGWDARLEGGVRALHALLGLDPDDPAATSTREPYRLEARHGTSTWTPSPVQWLLGLAAVAAIACGRGASRSRRLYAVSLAAGFTLSAATLRWSPHVVRLQFPLVLLGVPLASALFLDVPAGRRWRRAAGLALLAGLFGVAVRDATQANGRRLLGRRPDALRTRSELLFRGTDASLRPSAVEVGAWLAERGIDRIGLYPQQATLAEYPLWATLRESVRGLQYQVVAHLAKNLAHLAAEEPFASFVPQAVLFVSSPLPEGREPAPAELEHDGRRYVPAFETERITVLLPRD